MSRRALLAYVGPRNRFVESRLREFVALAEAAGYTVVDLVKQWGEADTRFYLGRGKLSELASRDFDVLITYHALTPLQYYLLSRELRRRVMDRVQLILEIFESRAGSLEAKLQIELARLRYELPRIREYLRRSKLGEQIWFMGGGEYISDAYYRLMRRREAQARERLREIRARRARLIEQKKASGLPVVAITGYTSAGKTTLFNALTREDKLVDGKPFATLDTYSRLVTFAGMRFIVTDTIGFIDDLPPSLIEAFYATLEEVVRSDLVLLVVDGAEPPDEVERKLRSSISILRSIAVDPGRVVAAVNKVDLLTQGEVREVVRLVRRFVGVAIPISARTGWGLRQLLTYLFYRMPRYVRVLSEYPIPPYGGLRIDDRYVVAVPEEEAHKLAHGNFLVRAQ